MSLELRTADVDARARLHRHDVAARQAKRQELMSRLFRQGVRINELGEDLTNDDLQGMLVRIGTGVSPEDFVAAAAAQNVSDFMRLRRQLRNGGNHAA